VKAQVVVARQQLDDATLTAPISGTVAVVAIASGDAVSAGSADATITIVGAGQKEVTTAIGINDVDSVKTGDTAHVTIDGVSTALSGRVTQIGVMNTSGTSGTTTTYPVTVLLDPTSTEVYDGAGATVSIDVGTARDVLTVPTSAVHSVGSLHTVTVLDGGKTSVRRVTLGMSGSDRVQVDSGLRAGQQIVLANLDEAVPSSTSTTTGFGPGGGGTFVRGSFGGGTTPGSFSGGLSGGGN
jgi:multidrug efflux pump subunit AcrA (membrane-fusion protein)